MILSASVVAACAAPVVPSAPPDATAARRGDIVADAVSGLTFDRPSTWVRWLPNDHAPINDGPIAYLSTEPLLPACAVPIGGEPHPPDDEGRACDWPLASLSEDGVLVTLVNGRLLRPIPDAGAPLVVNARPTRLQADRPGTCAHVGGDETVVVPIPTFTQPGATNLALVACLRGPDLDRLEGDLRGLLATLRVPWNASEEPRRNEGHGTHGRADPVPPTAPDPAPPPLRFEACCE